MTWKNKNRKIPGSVPTRALGVEPAGTMAILLITVPVRGKAPKTVAS